MIPQISRLTTTTAAGSYTSPLRLAGLLLAVSLSLATGPSCLAQATMTIHFVDEKSGHSIPCRVELRDAKGKPLKSRGALNHLPWTIVDGELVYRGKVGDYKFDVHHGPEWAGADGGFTLDKDGEGSDVVRLPRHANMADENYLAGDMLTFVPRSELTKWLPAEALHIALTCSAKLTAVPPVSEGKTTPNDAAAQEQADSYYDDRPGSGLLFHHWHPPAAVPEQVPAARLLVMAKQQAETRAEITRLWERDTPIWLASGRIDAIQILSEHNTRDGKSPLKVSDMYHPEPAQFKGPRGTGRLVENLYWQVLETGLRIPPSAGSAVGRSTSPLGYNRVYVHLPGTLHDTQRWGEALYAGRSFVTNGPLLRAKINDELPGYVFKSNKGTSLNLNVALKLTVADPVEYVDVIYNGDAIYHARLDEYAKQGGKIPPLEVTESGWIVVRVVTSREETYRLATTAPYYVEFDGQSRISKTACQMFLKWLEDSAAEQKKIPAVAKSAEPYVSASRQFWQKRVDDSNVE